MCHKLRPKGILANKKLITDQSEAKGRARVPNEQSEAKSPLEMGLGTTPGTQSRLGSVSPRVVRVNTINLNDNDAILWFTVFKLFSIEPEI